jgi:uncharacterized iron-regulated protein
MNRKAGLSILISNLFVLFISLSANAQLLDGNTLAPVKTQAIVDQIQPGSILIIGEMHGLAPVQSQQVEVLNALRAKGLKITVGFEFFNYTDQQAIDDYRSGQTTEADFLKAINWSGYSFDFYKSQLLFPEAILGETALGLNVPSFVTKQLSKGGYDSLTPEQKSLLPADFTMGNQGYKDRFDAAMGGHMSPDKLDLYFAAQSAWDDTISMNAANYIEQHPQDIFVIIIGEFHVAYGGGTPDRLSQRLLAKGLKPKITTISQLYVEGLTANEITSEVTPSSLYGKRSDFIWLSAPQTNP